MNKYFKAIGLSLVLALQVGCNDVLKGELEPSSDASLRLYESQNGDLVELLRGPASVEIDKDLSFTKLMKGETEALRLIVKQAGKSFLFFINAQDLKSDGRFEVSEVNLGQPVRIQGRLLTSKNTDKPRIHIEIFRGFSKSENPIWRFQSAPLESDLIKMIKSASPVQTQAAL